MGRLKPFWHNLVEGVTGSSGQTAVQPAQPSVDALVLGSLSSTFRSLLWRMAICMTPPPTPTSPD